MAKKEWQVRTKKKSGARGWKKHICKESALKQIYEIMRDRGSIESEITLYSIEDDGFVSTELTVTFDK
jgi:hypothetical protein